MSTSKNFAVSLNLSRYFNDHRQCARVFIKEDIETIEDLQKKISNVFIISDFYLTGTTNEYLPPCEDVRILRSGETVSVVPQKNAELSITTQSINGYEYRKQISLGKRKSHDRSSSLEQQLLMKNKIKQDTGKTKTEHKMKTKESICNDRAVIDEINHHQEKRRKKKKNEYDNTTIELEARQKEQHIEENPSLINYMEEYTENAVEMQQDIPKAIHDDVSVLSNNENQRNAQIVESISLCNDTAGIDEINHHQEKRRKKKRNGYDNTTIELEANQREQHIEKNPSPINYMEENAVEMQQDIPKAIRDHVSVLHSKINSNNENQRNAQIVESISDDEKGRRKDVSSDNEKAIEVPNYAVIKITENQESVRSNVKSSTEEYPKINNINIYRNDIVRTTKNVNNDSKTKALNDDKTEIRHHGIPQNDILPNDKDDYTISNLCSDTIKNNNRSIIRNITPIEFASDSIERQTSANSSNNVTKTESPVNFKLEVRRRKKQRIFQTPEQFRMSIQHFDHTKNVSKIEHLNPSSKDAEPDDVALKRISMNMEQCTDTLNTKDGPNVILSKTQNNNDVVEQQLIKNINPVSKLKPEIKVTPCSIINEESLSDNVTKSDSSNKENSTRNLFTTPAKEALDYDDSISINWDSISSIQDSSVDIVYKSNSGISGLQWLSGGTSRFSRNKELSGVGHFLEQLRNNQASSSAAAMVCSVPKGTDNVMEVENENCINVSGENLNYDTECSTVTFRKRRQRKRKSKRNQLILDDSIPSSMHYQFIKNQDNANVAVVVESSSVNVKRDIEH